MRTQGDIIDEIIVRLGVSTSVAFYTDAILADWVDHAHKWSSGYKKWPFTEGRISTTYVADSTSVEVGFNYPEGWKPDSIRFLQVGGKRFQKLNFYKYQEFREDFSDSKEKIFSDFGRLYFINPRADVSGTTTVWGQFTPATLGDPTDTTATTVFSDVAEEGNEAIVEEVVSYAKKKEKKPQEAEYHHGNATRILNEIWQKIQDEQYGYQSKDDQGMFHRIDVLGGVRRDELFKRDQFF